MPIVGARTTQLQLVFVSALDCLVHEAAFVGTSLAPLEDGSFVFVFQLGN